MIKLIYKSKKIIKEAISNITPVNKFYEISTTKNNSNKNREVSAIELNLYKENANDSFVKGKINFNNLTTNVKMNLTENALEDAVFEVISDNQISISNLNEYNYLLSINQVDENKVNLSFEVENTVMDIEVVGSVDVQDFINLCNNKVNVNQRIVCGGICVAAIVTVVSGGYCAWRTRSLSSDCVSAYQTCGAGCTYEFESSSCGGDCNITPPTP